MNLDQQIHNIVRDSVFIDFDLKVEIINYVKGVNAAEKKEVLAMLENLEKKKDAALKKALMNDEQKYKDFIQMMKFLKSEKLQSAESESKRKEQTVLSALEKEIQSL